MAEFKVEHMPLSVDSERLSQIDEELRAELGELLTDESLDQLEEAERRFEEKVLWGNG